MTTMPPAGVWGVRRVVRILPPRDLELVSLQTRSVTFRWSLSNETLTDAILLQTTEHVHENYTSHLVINSTYDLAGQRFDLDTLNSSMLPEAPAGTSVSLLPGNTTQCELDKLTALTYYTLCLYTVTGGSISAASQTFTFQTPPGQ